MKISIYKYKYMQYCKSTCYAYACKYNMHTSLIYLFELQRMAIVSPILSLKEDTCNYVQDQINV